MLLPHHTTSRSFSPTSKCFVAFLVLQIFWLPIAHAMGACEAKKTQPVSGKYEFIEDFSIAKFEEVTTEIPPFREATFGSTDPSKGKPPAPNIRVVGDVNNDGIDDIVIEYIETAVAPVFLFGTRSGKFNLMPFLDAASARRHIRDGELVDINRDGYADFVGFTTSDHVEYWRQNGVELEPGEDNILLINENGRTFRPVDLPRLRENDINHGGLVADLNNDGFPEIIPLSEDAELESVPIENLDGIDFRLGPSNLSQMVTDSWVEDGDSGDFNGDGFIDLIISIAPSHNEDRSPVGVNARGTLQIIMGDGDLDFSNNESFTIGKTWMGTEEARKAIKSLLGVDPKEQLHKFMEAGTARIDVFDLDEDGKPDVLEGQYVRVFGVPEMRDWRTSGFKAYLNRGECLEDATDSVFPNQLNNRKLIDKKPTNYIERFYHKDINNDGFRDVILQAMDWRRNSTWTHSYPYIFINLSNQKFLPVKTEGVERLLGLREIVAGDFNGDGKGDLAALKNTTLYVFLNPPYDFENGTKVTEIENTRQRYEKYDRSVSGLNARFECLFKEARDGGIGGLPNEQQVSMLIEKIKDNQHYRTSRHLQKFGLPKEMVKKHKALLLRLINFEGSNDTFCERPILN